MSYAIDANILLYAANESSGQRHQAAAFLEMCAARSELMCVTEGALMAFVRIATHPSIFPSPLSWQDAIANVEALIALPHFRVLHGGDGFWHTFKSVTDKPARGNLVSDANQAAVLKQNGVTTIYTNDDDFRRFTFLTVKNPLEAQ